MAKKKRPKKQKGKEGEQPSERCTPADIRLRNTQEPCRWLRSWAVGQNIPDSVNSSLTCSWKGMRANEKAD
jgi:hypothetical protein